MTNEERQKSLESKRIKQGTECGQEIYCKFCQYESNTPCAKAFNRMNYQNAGTERAKYSWRNDF